MKKLGIALDMILSLPFGAVGFLMCFVVTSVVWGFRLYSRWILWLAGVNQ